MTRPHTPSADRLGNAPYVYGKLRPMTPEDRAFWRWFNERKERKNG